MTLLQNSAKYSEDVPAHRNRTF